MTNAQHEAEQLKAKLERLRDTWPEDAMQDLLTCVDMATVAKHNGMMMSRCLVIALRQIRGLGELTVRTRYHGRVEWRDCCGREDRTFWLPMYEHADDARYADSATDRRISLELFIAATIETWRRMRPGVELVDYALELCP